MKFGPEWMSCESVAQRTPRHPQPPQIIGPAIHAHGPWAYRAKEGLTPRAQEDAEGGPLEPDVVALFETLWRSDILPDPEDLRRFASSSTVLRRRILVSAPRYWRCMVDELVCADQASGYLVSRCDHADGRLRHRAELTTTIPDDLGLEPVARVVLYEVERSVAAAKDGRRPAFLEVFCDESRFVVHFEHGSVVQGLSCDPDPGARRVEYSSIQAMQADSGISLRDVGLIMCRDPGLSSRELLELELEFRGVSAAIEETSEGISFVTGSRRFRGITTFEDMRDILRWNARDF